MKVCLTKNLRGEKKVVAIHNRKKMILITVATCVDYFLKYAVKIPWRTSRLTRSNLVNEILNGYPIHCYEQFRIKKHVFLHLCDILETTYNLRLTKCIGIHEQKGIFLYIIRQQVQFIMQKRGSSIQGKPCDLPLVTFH